MNIGWATMDWSISYRDLAGLPTLGGSGWARLGLPARALAARGHNVVIGTLLFDRESEVLGVKTWTGRLLAGFDVLVMQRWMDDEIVDAVRKARANGQVIVNDVDDYYWRLDPRNQAHRIVDPRVNPSFNSDHYMKMLRDSTLVTTSTPYLAQALRDMGVPRVKVLRNAWSPREWTPQAVDREPPTIGWVGALPWRSGDLEELRGVMDRFLSAHPGVHFHHGGDVPGRGDVAEALALSPENAAKVTREPLAPILEYPALWKPLDIAVIPLSLQPFNYAKSAIKGMEAAAAGVPFVATPTPEYEWLHRRGVGRLAKRHRDWLRELERLLDPDERRRQAKANREALGPLDIAERVLEYESCYEALV